MVGEEDWWAELDQWAKSARAKPKQWEPFLDELGARLLRWHAVPIDDLAEADLAVLRRGTTPLAPESGWSAASPEECSATRGEQATAFEGQAEAAIALLERESGFLLHPLVAAQVVRDRQTLGSTRLSAPLDIRGYPTGVPLKEIEEAEASRDDSESGANLTEGDRGSYNRWISRARHRVERVVALLGRLGKQGEQPSLDPDLFAEEYLHARAHIERTKWAKKRLAKARAACEGCPPDGERRAAEFKAARIEFAVLLNGLLTPEGQEGVDGRIYRDDVIVEAAARCGVSLARGAIRRQIRAGHIRVPTLAEYRQWKSEATKRRAPGFGAEK